MGIKILTKGDYNKAFRFFQNLKEFNIDNILKKYGEIGVRELMLNTPRRTGLTASSWRYEIEHGNGTSSLIFINDNVNKGVNIAILLQYGHGTRNGGYVKGIDYINPSLEPIFEELAEKAWKEVTST